MFRDRGDVHGFFPPDGDMAAHAELLARVPNLDSYDHHSGLVKHSLGNALRIIRPVVVVDEGQKATSDLATKTLYGFNPSYVLELTATPKDAPKGDPPRHANVLREITGAQLNEEGMIKMPLNLDPRDGTDWHDTLRASLDRLNALQREAEEYRADTNRTIRPIMLVQVERTGEDQRNSKFIHAEDAREWLLAAGLDEAEIAVKTAETNDLAQPENQDLLSPTNRVRAIITKQALQEGWDCPFAYVLCSLAAVGNLSAMTQLIGRILRQPHAMKTGVPALDEAYVVTHRAETAEVVKAIKDGLEKEGLADLVLNVAGGGNDVPKSARTVTLKRRAGMEQTITLPKVLVVGNDGARELDYRTDILAAIDWRDYDPALIAADVPTDPAKARQLVRIAPNDDGTFTDVWAAANDMNADRFDRTHAARMIGDIVLNPFVAHTIATTFGRALEARGMDEAARGAVQGIALDMLRRALADERDTRAEAVFRDGIKAGRVQFRLRADGENWTIPEAIVTTEPDPDTPLSYKGHPTRKSVFDPVYQAEFNNDERKVAIWLDAHDALAWWHRAVAKGAGGYALKGWMPNRVFPDFVFASNRADGTSRLVALETKGDHLKGNDDTNYKRDLMRTLSEAFSIDVAPSPGTLALATPDGTTVECALVQLEGWEPEVAKLVG